jgi:hypothetical protein
MPEQTVSIRTAGRKVALSARALAVLEQMDSNRSYDATELRRFAPDLTLEALHDVMRELWVARQVERTGYSGWRRERSTGGGSGAPRSPGDRRHTPSRPKLVKPEDLFDHSAFEGLFK